MGAATCTIAVAGRWDSEAEAGTSASAPPPPTPQIGVQYAPVHAYELWAMAPAPSAPDVSPGHRSAQGPSVQQRANTQEPSVRGSTDDECPETVARRASRQRCPV